jgi:hypothetical protein
VRTRFPALAVLAALVTLPACISGGGGSTTMQFFPLQGQIAEDDPALVIEAKMQNVQGTSGPISLRLPGRNRCEGTWTSLTPKTVSRSRGVSLTWRKTGGEIGAESETVAGVNDGEVYAVCEDGTRVQGTFVIGSGTASGTGQATDTNGNVYKLLF